jgi:hypothetical protein
VEHLYARALLDQGRSADALAAEKRVLERCADPYLIVPACSTWLIASATRRTEILEQLVQLGIEDANAHPEASSLAYHNATRQVSLSVRLPSALAHLHFALISLTSLVPPPVAPRAASEQTR